MDLFIDEKMERLLQMAAQTECLEPVGDVLHPVDDIEFLDIWDHGTLSTEQRKKLNSHLADCAYCRSAVAEMVKDGVLTVPLLLDSDFDDPKWFLFFRSISPHNIRNVISAIAIILFICTIGGLYLSSLLSPHGIDIALKTDRPSLVDYGYNMSGNMTVKDVPKTEAEEKAQYLDRLNKNPDDVELRFEFGHWLLSKMDISEAITQFEMLEKTHPKSATIQNALGMAWYMQETNRGDAPEEAHRCFSQALKFNPNDPDANRNMGICLNKMGKSEEARAYFEKANRFSK